MPFTWLQIPTTVFLADALICSWHGMDVIGYDSTVAVNHWALTEWYSRGASVKGLASTLLSTKPWHLGKNVLSEKEQLGPWTHISFLFSKCHHWGFVRIFAWAFYELLLQCFCNYFSGLCQNCMYTSSKKPQGSLSGALRSYGWVSSKIFVCILLSMQLDAAISSAWSPSSLCFSCQKASSALLRRWAACDLVHGFLPLLPLRSELRASSWTLSPPQENRWYYWAVETDFCRSLKTEVFDLQATTKSNKSSANSWIRFTQKKFVFTVEPTGIPSCHQHMISESSHV